MLESWRWFGPDDPVTIADIRQTGATDIVSGLHAIPIGETWSVEAIRAHQQLIEVKGDLTWSVVESIPVHEAIKQGLDNHQVYVDNWIKSMENLAECGIKTICYNFMPVLDWTRTDIKHPLPSGGYTLRFDQNQFAAFDLFILKRANAEQDYSTAEIVTAKQLYAEMSVEQQQELSHTIRAGLPGKMAEAYDLEQFRQALDDYQHISKDVLRNNLFKFLAQVLPIAEKLGVKLAIHPDDPPRDMFGLPRIICTAADLELLFGKLPSPSNGITLCVGSYSSRADNDIPQMAKQFGERIHFAHLRGVSRDKDEQRSFIEASHLASDVDMVSIISALLSEEKNRQQKSNGSAKQIFIRPDHGHQLLSDINKKGNPGYTCIGRLKGLAEIRGVIKTLEQLN